MSEAAPWWEGELSILNEKATDFILAMWGLVKAHRRLQVERDDINLFIECSWWIGAATEACDRRRDGTVLEGFYWVRNKGFHETTKAMGQIIPRGRPQVGRQRLDELGPDSPPRWAHLDGDEGSKRAYNEHLATRPIAETIEQALAILLEVADRMGKESGLTDLDEFREIL